MIYITICHYPRLNPIVAGPSDDDIGAWLTLMPDDNPMPDKPPRVCPKRVESILFGAVWPPCRAPELLAP